MTRLATAMPDISTFIFTTTQRLSHHLRRRHSLHHHFDCSILGPTRYSMADYWRACRVAPRSLVAPKQPRPRPLAARPTTTRSSSIYSRAAAAHPNRIRSRPVVDPAGSNRVLGAIEVVAQVGSVPPTYSGVTIHVTVSDSRVAASATLPAAEMALYGRTRLAWETLNLVPPNPSSSCGHWQLK